MSKAMLIDRQLAPLCFMPDGSLVCYQYGCSDRL